MLIEVPDEHHGLVIGPAVGTAVALPPVDLAAMAQSHDDHKQHVILNRVNDAVVTNANSKARSALQGFRS